MKGLKIVVFVFVFLFMVISLTNQNLVTKLMNLHMTVEAGHSLTNGTYCDGNCINGRCSGCSIDCSDGSQPIAQDSKEKNTKTQLGTLPILMALVIYFLYYRI